MAEARENLPALLNLDVVDMTARADAGREILSLPHYIVNALVPEPCAPGGSMLDCQMFKELTVVIAQRTDYLQARPKAFENRLCGSS